MKKLESSYTVQKRKWYNHFVPKSSSKARTYQHCAEVPALEFGKSRGHGQKCKVEAVRRVRVTEGAGWDCHGMPGLAAPLPTGAS